MRTVARVDSFEWDALWAGGGRAGMTRLCALFPSLADVPGTDPWDSAQVLAWLCERPEVSRPAEHAARFALGVWRSFIDWNEVAHCEGLLPPRVRLEPFDVFGALGTWDEEDARAFRTWASTPFWG